MEQPDNLVIEPEIRSSALKLNPLNLFTEEQQAQLFKNSSITQQEDIFPVALFISMRKEHQWMLTSIDPEQPHRAFGIADLQPGGIHLGLIDLNEILAFTYKKPGSFDGDILIPDFGEFKAEFSIVRYYKMALAEGCITTNDHFHKRMLATRGKRDISFYKPELIL